MIQVLTLLGPLQQPRIDRTDRSAFKHSNQRTAISVHKTDVSKTDPFQNPSRMNGFEEKPDTGKWCPLHKKPHPLTKCRSFRGKPLEERKAFIKENGICFKCCSSSSHIAKHCEMIVKCSECESDRHNSALHPGPAPWARVQPATEDGGEERYNLSASVSSSCTKVCGEGQTGKSCSKISLVKVFPTGQRERAIKVYAILDDQSNRSLACSAFFSLFKIEGPSSPYSLNTCAGVASTAGRRANGYQVESINGKMCLNLPTLIECNEIPNNRLEIPTPEAASQHLHLRAVSHQIPKLDPQAPIMLFLGRDIIRVHKVREQVNGPHDSPYAQRLDLGWVIIGTVCLGGLHAPTTVNTFYTNTLENGRPTLFQPCPNRFTVKEKYNNMLHSKTHGHLPCDGDTLGCCIFQRTHKDDMIAPSIEDEVFLNLMEQGFRKDDSNSWVAPLPFKSQRRRLPDNRAQALHRLLSLKRNLQRKPEMKDHFLTFMDKIFENGHAELAPNLTEGEERWYLPIFGVYHPKKPSQIRVVFDSSAQHDGVSLNNVLLTGPDLNNTLLGVLIRFRKEPVAITADIQKMFHCFLVEPEHRNFLRFLWFKNNDLTKEVIEYRMRVHVFGNSPSPAVAIYGLRRAAQEGDSESGPDVVTLWKETFMWMMALSHSRLSTLQSVCSKQRSTCSLSPTLDYIRLLLIAEKS